MFKTMLIALFIGLIGLLDLASAQPVRILISIKKQNISHRFQRKMIHQLSKRGFEESDFRVSENADQFELYQALNDPETQAVVWISHGATPRLTRKMKRKLSGSMGMSAQPELIDYRGDNVAPIFKKYSSNLKYVAVIGCNSEQILDYVESDLATNDSIEKFIPSKKIIAQFAIRRASKQLSHITINETTSAQPIDPIETQISFTRSIPENADPDLIRPLRIMIGKELVGVLPAIKPGETIQWSIPLMNSDVKQVRLESGQNIMTPADETLFGDITITLPNQIEMKPFAKQDGTPFGLNFRLYILP